MAEQPLRIGLIGAGSNMKQRHIPGLRALPNVEIVAVCNRRLQSSKAVADEYNIPRIYAHWQDVVACPDIDAIIIGTWPYLHCPVSLAALEMGKHVLTEARMAMNAQEAHRMLAASQQYPHLVCQIVPSPFGLKGHTVFQELLDTGFIGQPREMHVYGMNQALLDPAVPLSWRQDASLSGYNMLMLGILHETVSRWVAPASRVFAQANAFISSRIDPSSGVRRVVGTPDSVQILTIHEDGMRGIYQFSGITPFAPGMAVRIYGSEGTLEYDFDHEIIRGARIDEHAHSNTLIEMEIPPEKAGGWSVEADFVNAIRHGQPVEFTPFEAGVQYMEFTEAVARSAELHQPISLPLSEYRNNK